MMTTESSLDHSGLHWIRREVEEGLRQACLVLEDFVAGDAEDLEPAIRSLHQVRGALTLTRIHGAAMLAAELEWLARRLNEDRVGSREAAVEVFMCGIAQLSAYLDRIESGESDIPLILLPMMNDLRAAYEAPLVSEISLFAPCLDAQLEAEPVKPGSGNPQLPELIAGLRMDYHRALLKWFRDLDTPGGLESLRDLIDQVSSAAGTARLRRLLDAAEALLVAIAEGSVKTTSAVKLLYGQLDRVFKRAIDRGEEAIAQEFPVELLKNFLYYIARSDSVDPVVLAVRHTANLENSFPDLSEEDLCEGRFIGAGHELFESVAQALEEDLQCIKDQLDLCMRGDRQDIERFSSLAESVRRMADTLGMIGQGGLRSRLVPHADMIRDAVGNGELPDDVWLDQLAWDLLSVQSALPTLSESGFSRDEEAANKAIVLESEYRHTLKVALEQALVELARFKEVLSTYFDTGELGILESGSTILHRLSGVFSVLDRQVVGDLFVGLHGYVEALLSGQRGAPDAGERDRLGDMVSGIEVHLESLLEPSPDRQCALQVAGEAAGHMGLVELSGTEDGCEAVSRDPVATDALEEHESGAEPLAPTTEAAEVTGAEVVNVIEQSVCEPVEATGEPMSEVDDDGSSVLDSETLSISVAEARDELQTPFPVWREDPADREELTRILTTDEHPPIELDETLHQIFIREAETHLATMKSFIARCRGIANGCVFDDALRRALHTLHGSAHMAQIVSVAGLAGTLEHLASLCHELSHRTDQAAIDLFERGYFIISALLAVINVPGARMPSWQALMKEIELEIKALEDAKEPETGEANVQSGNQAASLYDEELVAIFVDEARELLDRLESGMADWEVRPDDLLPVVHMQRGLHTIKGGARLSGVSAIGDLSHAMESLLESVVDQRVHSTPDIVRITRQALDVLTAQIEALEQDEAVEVQEALVENLQAVARGESFALSAQEPGEAGDDRSARLNIEEDASELELLDDTELDSLEQAASGLSQSTLLTDSQLLIESDLVASSSMVATGDSESLSGMSADLPVIQFPARGRLAEDEPPRRPPPPEEEKGTTPKERVRVCADLLDRMVNNAGEVGICGARLEQQNKTLGYNLDELAQTIGRLRKQLCKLENETEAQILSRHERENEGELPDGFDPLEMDRYSTIQQLSRALAETTEDMNSICVTLQEQSRDTDTLLQQQSRITNDLQDGLLRTRMIPVGSRASRLQRVVRQTAEMLGKQAEFALTGAAGEMDRAILERMMGPLEHLLRNAVVHGIEASNDRRAAGKPPAGKVSLVVSWDGPNMVLEVSDDGRGLDKKAIRRRAVERGLLDPEAHIDDDDLNAFILEVGLSTVHEVTQVAGRGVGMDVVVNEVKQLGGTLDIDSQPGLGTRFTIRLPFTQAISDALLVGIDDEVFAVPHGRLAGIARISRRDLKSCYRGERATFSHGGHEYTVRHLGRLLGIGSPRLPRGERWIPLLLVHSGEHRTAIQVDRLLGNYQIVVKSLGTQLAGIHWFTGGTILADGGIALILDVGALVRMESAYQAMLEPLAECEEEVAGVKIMVVDDSITVRKVASRLLERHNMRVITARDGVDAMALLQTERPDVMLLDIEMPRMDGFELVRYMCSTEALKDISIIMITSRTGSKHREYAQELGVRHYLGKPYRESELLENIHTVLAEVTS